MPTHHRLLQLFALERPLDFVAMDILAPLHKTKTGNKYVVVMANCYYKMTMAFSAKTTTVTNAARKFINDLVIFYGIPARLLTDNEPRLVEKLFNAVFAALGTNLMTKTAYHLQTERYNETNVSQVRRYIEIH